MAEITLPPEPENLVLARLRQIREARALWGFVGAMFAIGIVGQILEPVLEPLLRGIFMLMLYGVCAIFIAGVLYLIYDELFIGKERARRRS
jgi:hypothetical protein